eukprot:Phypoly_transcript_13830.p1 GENE.Phypoly_transcript_13830~~Phypoly_transcript_13830.p1  ORF type:complete len:276 (+),score=14.18 Phypoly_transcript_13830:71-898(+)
MNRNEILLTCAIDLAIVLHICNYIYWADKYASWLYIKGLTTKNKSSINYDISGRDYKRMLWENFVVGISTGLFPAWVLAHYLLQHTTIDFSMKLLETWLAMISLYFCFDTWYFFSHKFVHTIPCLYKAIHKHHHDLLPIDAYTTARAEFSENLIMTSPGAALWVFVYFNVVQVPNIWSLLIPVFSVTSDVVLGHVGYYDTIYLYAINPFSLIVQYSFFSKSGLATRHELHHYYFTKNFSPLLPWMDRIFGTNIDPVPDRWNVTYEDEKMHKKVPK